MATSDDYNKQSAYIKLIEKASAYWGGDGNLAAAFLSKQGVDTNFMKPPHLFKMGPYKDDPNHLWIDVSVSKDDIPRTKINEVVAKSKGAVDFEKDPTKQSKAENGLSLKIKKADLETFVKEVETQIGQACSAAIDQRMPYQSIADLPSCTNAPGNKKGQALGAAIDGLRR